jgi:hypothetical protein
MDLDIALALAQIISLGFVAPVAGFRIWRKLDERLTEQDKRLVRIEYQLYENGGQSMKDQINCITADINSLKVNQAIIKTKVGV